MDVSLSGTIKQKTYLKKFWGASSPLAPPWIRLCNIRENSSEPQCLAPNQ